MLFNSYVFIFTFLPIALIGYQIAAKIHRKAVIAWLGLMSLAFYANWRPAFVLLLLGSIGLNFTAARLISRQIPSKVSSRVWMWTAIAVNIGILGYFKYLFPVLNFWNAAVGSHARWENVILPLGISFFTFTQIAYLIDLQQGTAKQEDALSYLLFVTFFPHLIAGPILHHQEMMPQFKKERYGLKLDDLAVGFSWFVMGLGKKVLIADHLAETVNVIYSAPGPLPALLAWRGVLGYAMQLYFDFSGYSDMALGLARMFSIDFPLNFSSPYKATNIIDFWQRWHITLTRYITTYVYSPLQMGISARRQAKGKKVSRKAMATPEGFIAMTAYPMILTMLIAGVWHGAGLQFIVFGVLHGCYLTVNHGWNLYKHKSRQQGSEEPRSAISRAAGHAGAVLLTFFCVLIAQVFFRANSCRHALSILSGMAGLHGLGVRVGLTGETPGMIARRFLAIGVSFAIVWGMPNTQQILGRFKPALDSTVWDTKIKAKALLWYPNLKWAAGLGAVLFVVLVRLQDPSTFLYFQF